MFQPSISSSSIFTNSYEVLVLASYNTTFVQSFFSSFHGFNFSKVATIDENILWQHSCHGQPLTRNLCFKYLHSQNNIVKTDVLPAVVIQ